MRPGDLSQGEDLVHDDPRLPALEERRHIGEALGLAGQEGAKQRLVLRVERREIAVRREDRRDPAEGSRDGGAQPYVAARRVEGRIDACAARLGEDALGRPRVAVVDRDIGPELGQEALVAGPGRRDDAGASRLAELDGERPDAASTTVNQQGLAGTDLKAADHRLPRRAARERHARRLDM